LASRILDHSTLDSIVPAAPDERRDPIEVKKSFLWLAIFAVGVAVGIYLQHVRPLGHLRDEFSAVPRLAGRTPADLARLSRSRRLVLVATGQSNAANFGEPRGAAGAGVYAFANGQLWIATDPLPGGDGFGGSIWSRLGARLMIAGHYEAVVLAVVARGSTAVADWAPGGGRHDRLMTTLHGLESAGLPVDSVLWQQGETEAESESASGRAYRESLVALIAACHDAAPTAKFYVAQATFAANAPLNEQVRLAQTMAPGAVPGPDIDRLGGEFRRDGIHFNDRGLAAAADLWLQALRAGGTLP
jgi:carbohydrate esterase-like sialic acid-specific acetylesterase